MDLTRGSPEHERLERELKTRHKVLINREIEAAKRLESLQPEQMSFQDIELLFRKLGK